MVEILIIEDEPPAARRMASMIESHSPGATISHAQELVDAEDKLSTCKYDVIFLDLNLRGLDGFKILERISSQCAVVVVSAHIERALEAFDHGVIDFVPKPVVASRLNLAIDRALEVTQSPPKNLPVRSTTGIEIIQFNDIVSVSAVEDYSEIRLRNGRTHIDERSLSDIDHRANGQLIRIHRSHLVNRSDLQEIRNKDGTTSAVLKDGTRLPIARRKLKSVKSALTKIS